VADWISKSDVDIIVVGDFNASFGSLEYNAFRYSGYETVIDGDCTAEKLQNCSYIVPEYASIIDHILVNSSVKLRLKGSGIMSVSDGGENYLSTQSDHVPVWALFRTNL
jgi:exonuclease III